MQSLKTIKTCTSLAIVLLTFFVLSDVAVAGPGGIIKGASQTLWGKIIMGGVLLFFAPLITWYLLKRAILVKKTRQLLKQIALSDSRFEWMELKDRVTQVFLWVHSAWDQKKMDIAGQYVTDWYRQNQQLLLDKWDRDGLENKVSDVAIKKITPLYVAQNIKDDSKNRLVVEIEAEMRDHMITKDTGKITQGDKRLGTVTTIWSFVWQQNNWQLNLIEAGDMDMEYLSEPNKVYALDEGTAA